MKKSILLAAAAALILASCGKNEVIVPVQEDIPVGFSNYAPRAITKADTSLVNTGALPVGAKIGVYGYSTGTSNLGTGFTYKPEFMTDAKVDYGSNTSATATATDPVRYWPKTITNLLSFYAYYPRESAGISGKPTASTEGMGTLTFTQKDTVALMEDFMISDIANDQYYFKEGDTDPASVNGNGVKAVNGVVPLVFNHMLTKVNFKFRTVSDYGNDIKIRVTSAKVENALSKAVITPSYTAAAAGDLGNTSFAYSSDTPYTKDIYIPFADTLTLSTSAALNVGDTITHTDFLFVPQALSDTTNVTISFVIEQDGTVTENTATVQLNKVKDTSAQEITEWGINDFVTYIFSIGLKEIKFTGEATNWNPVIVGNYTIE